MRVALRTFQCLFLEAQRQPEVWARSVAACTHREHAGLVTTIEAEKHNAWLFDGRDSRLDGIEKKGWMPRVSDGIDEEADSPEELNC